MPLAETSYPNFGEKTRDKILPRIVGIKHLTKRHIPEVRHVYASNPNATKDVWLETVYKIRKIYNFFTDKTPVWVDCEGALQQATNCRKVYKITFYLSYLICYLWLICSINLLAPEFDI
jgi:hypothetical protein